MAAIDSKDVTITDGSLSFSGGVDSVKTPTIQSARNPDGLGRSQLAWLINATVRDGGITQRWGWQKRGVTHDGSALFQGSFMYEPVNALPYLVVAIGGIIYSVDPDTGQAADISGGLTMPADQDYFYFAQAEQFLVIQAGDNLTLPLFWDGTTMRRSKGITNQAVAPGTPGINEIPAATAMDYFMGRLWYAQGRQYSAGDIVNGPSGTLAYDFRDSVLNVTENPLVVGGDGFTVPTQDGSIRALKHGAAIDAALGEGRLFVFTRKAVYALQVPVTRADWIAAGNNNQPLQVVVQLVNGSVNDRSIVAVNGDLFFQSLEPGIRSLLQAVRYFTQWGNIQISSNENRILQFNDRELMRFSSGIFFENRLLETSLPVQTPQGVVSPAIIPMDFIPISSFQQQRQPTWEGTYDGLNVLQLLVGDFGGRQRAFALVVSAAGTIDLWELIIGRQRDDEDNRVTWVVETPSFTWGDEFKLKKLVGMELWVDRLIGTVVFQVEWRPDSATCWLMWHKWKECSVRNSAEDPVNPITYPLLEFGPCYRATMNLPVPPNDCGPCNVNRPAAIGYQMQLRLTIHGFCRIRGFQIFAEPVAKQPYIGLVC